MQLGEMQNIKLLMGNKRLTPSTYTRLSILFQLVQVWLRPV
jgi:hypothetical protein